MGVTGACAPTYRSAMKTRAAVAYEVNAPWVIDEFEIREPGPEEMLIRMAYAGLCHSDEHIRFGDFTADALPMVCGHEGSGVVEAVGDRVRGFAPGDHVAASFIPSCGRCPSCAAGMQYLCDNGAEIMYGTESFVGPRGPVRAMSGIGTFSEYAVVHENSVVPVGDWYPLEAVSLCSCGVATGWGSAVNVADVRAGDTVVVIGTGGIGVNAVQGAAMAGAANVIAVDPAFHGKGLGRGLVVSGLDSIARRTPGFTGADLANLLNEAAILTARRRKETISLSEIDDAVDRIIAGAIRIRSTRIGATTPLAQYHMADSYKV